MNSKKVFSQGSFNEFAGVEEQSTNFVQNQYRKWFGLPALENREQSKDNIQLNVSEDLNLANQNFEIFGRSEFYVDFFESQKAVLVDQFVADLEENECEYWKLLRLSLNSQIDIFHPKNSKLSKVNKEEFSDSFLHSILLNINPNSLRTEKSETASKLASLTKIEENFHFNEFSKKEVEEYELANLEGESEQEIDQALEENESIESSDGVPEKVRERLEGSKNSEKQCEFHRNDLKTDTKNNNNEGFERNFSKDKMRRASNDRINEGERNPQVENKLDNSNGNYNHRRNNNFGFQKRNEDNYYFERQRREEFQRNQKNNGFENKKIPYKPNKYN